MRQGSGLSGKSQIALGFLKNISMDPFEKQFYPQGLIASRGRLVRPLYNKLMTERTNKTNEPKALSTPTPPRPRGYKPFFMLNSTEHEIPTAGKN